VTVTKVLTLEGAGITARKEWAKRRKELFGFETDQEYPQYPFHPEAKHTIIATCTIDKGKISRDGYIPCLINKQAQRRYANGIKKASRFLITLTR
jgi:hypothetical protein